MSVESDRLVLLSGSVHAEEAVRYHAGYAVYAGLTGIHGQGKAAPVNDAGLAHREKLFSSEVDILDDELAGGVFLRKPFGETSQRPGDAIMPERVRQIGEFVGFCHNDAIEAYGFRVDHQRDDGCSSLLKGRTQVWLRCLRDGFQRVETCAATFFKKSREQVGFVFEMVIERSLRNTRQLGDLRHGCPFIALLEEKLSRTLEDLLIFAGCPFAVTGRALGRLFGLGHRPVEGLLLRMGEHDRPPERHGPYGRIVSSPFYVDYSSGAAL